jgi:nucleotide-binding universal stress UspA family protein
MEVHVVPITSILCPIDFSEVSRHAFDRAVGVARCYGAVIHVLHVLPVHAAVSAVPFGPEGPGAFSLLDRDRVLHDLPGFLATEHPIGVSMDYHVLDAPVVHREVLVQAQRVAADLVVIGTHGRAGFERLVLGSVAEKVLRTSSVAVLTVPPRAPDVVPATRDPFSRIL